MTINRMTRPDSVVTCNLINIHTTYYIQYTYIHTYIHNTYTHTYIYIYCDLQHRSIRYFLYHKCCPPQTKGGYGKIKVYINWSMVIPEKAVVPVTGTLGSERQRYAIAGPDKTRG